MTLPAIIASRPEIAKEVYEKYPISKAEKRCENEKATMDQLRFAMAKKLMEKPSEKAEYK